MRVEMWLLFEGSEEKAAVDSFLSDPGSSGAILICKKHYNVMKSMKKTVFLTCTNILLCANLPQC